MPSFTRVIRDAYADVLAREPDPGGLADYNRAMNQGLSEADLRERLMRSREFALRFPDAQLPSRLGLNVHVPDDTILDDVARNLGIGWIRVDFDWYRIQPEPDRFDWEPLDRVIDRSARLGLEVLATLAYTPAWASSRPGSPAIADPPADTRFWTDFVRLALERFRGRVRHFQFWNEPNVREFWNGTMVQYRTAILEPAAELARSVDPSLRIVAPGLANLRDWRDWFREAMNARDSIDVVNHHNYASDGRDAILALEEDRFLQPSLRTLIREEGVEDRPFWLTETGRRSDAGNQREYYEDLLVVLQERAWVNRVFFFHYTDGPGQGDGGFGIVTEALTPKETYYALQAVVRASSGSNRAASGAPPSPSPKRGRAGSTGRAGARRRAGDG
jgi:hypothetical protein